MREILFRGKRIDNGEWVYGDLVQSPAHCVVQIYEQDLCGDNFAVDPSTVGQYTGLTANGKKIFEGDIVRFSTPYCLYTAPIVYQNGVWCADNKREASFTLYSIMKLTPEVIGNIHDNPELMEDEQ